MFKHLSLVALCAFPLSSIEATVQADADTEVFENLAADQTAAEDALQPLTQSVALIIEDLNKATVMLDNAYAKAVIVDLQIIDDTAKGFLVYLIALLKSGKLEDAGVPKEQLQQLAHAFNQFHTKFCAFKKSQTATLTSEEVIISSK